MWNVNQWSDLSGTGKLHWSIGYFTKAPLLKELERAPTVDEAKAEPAPVKTHTEKEMMPQDKAPHPAKKDLPPTPPDVQKTRPDPQWPSGVLSIILHQVSIPLWKVKVRLMNVGQQSRETKPRGEIWSPRR